MRRTYILISNRKAAIYLKLRALIKTSNKNGAKIKGFEAFSNSNTDPLSIN